MANDFNATAKWNAGDGYQVVDDYLNLPDYSKGGDADLKQNYYGGSDDVNTAYKGLLNQGGITLPSNYENSVSQGGISNIGASLGSTGDAGSTAGAIGGALGTAASIYNNSSTDTGSSVLSGAASGAAAGTMIMPGIGTAIGAVVGGLIGFFGSKSKKAAAKKQFQADLQLATAPQMQAQANYLQNQKLTQAAISPYAAGYTPGGYQYKNKAFGGGPSSAIPQPQSGQLNIPNGPPQLTSPGIGKPLQTNIPEASFTPNTSTGLVAPTNTYQFNPTPAPTAPKYTGNKAQDQANINAYAKQYGLSLYQQDQQAAADAMNPYAQFYNKGYGYNGA